jgi:hypothetical protein
MWRFVITSGAILRDGRTMGVGYSGHGPGRNNAAMVAMANIGPLPPGRYRIGAPYDDPHLGPCVMHLDPLPGDEMFGRSLFRIHGDNAAHDASRGCLVTPPYVRHAIAASKDMFLTVTA